MENLYGKDWLLARGDQQQFLSQGIGFKVYEVTAREGEESAKSLSEKKLTK
jgi:hypothetical protein